MGAPDQLTGPFAFLAGTAPRHHRHVAGMAVLVRLPEGLDAVPELRPAHEQARAGRPDTAFRPAPVPGVSLGDQGTVSFDPRGIQGGYHDPGCFLVVGV